MNGRNACGNIWGGELKTMVEERGAKGGVLVVRPDSGDPPTVVVKVLDILGK
jgi:nicotinamide phosphoribosyltransferase